MYFTVNLDSNMGSFVLCEANTRPYEVFVQHEQVEMFEEKPKKFTTRDEAKAFIKRHCAESDHAYVNVHRGEAR
jgi:hypothetical protein